MTNSKPSPADTHIVVLLDRSGSMASIATDVIGCFNTFLAEQQANGPDARLTLIQFDSQNPMDVVTSAIPIREALPLTAETFQPRGGTPLLDATGLAIGRVRAEAAGTDSKADVVFVSITDGEENQSREFTLERVRQLITECEAAGWTFVFLSAALDAYGDAERFGLRHGNIQAFDADGVGSQMAFASTAYNLSLLREKKRRGVDTSNDVFFEDGKPAEKRRKGSEDQPGS